MIQINPHDLFSDHGTAEPAPAMDMMAARAAALEVLDSLLGGKHPLDQALEDHKGLKTLPARDRAFCRMLVATTLRRLGQIDDLIAKLEEKPGHRNLTLRNILRLGLTQLLFMDVPDHAAVDTSVRLTDAAELDRQKGFVNALLRNAARSGREHIARQDEARLNTPEWLLKIWIEDYGLRAAGMIGKAHLAEAALDITVKDKASMAHWGAQLKASSIGVGTLRRLPGGAVQDLPGFNDGEWFVQDAAAAIPASLFGDVRGRTVVDLCAAPGGKTMQLASRGAQVLAVDRSAQRLKKLEQNLGRLRLKDRVQIFAADGAEWSPQEAPQMILLDAPCTATGTIRRHPDVPHLKTPTDLSNLVQVQARLLSHAFEILAPSGVLIYCTCSLQKAEGEQQIAALIERDERAVKLAIRPEEIGGLSEPVTEHGDLRILPFHQAASGGMDGFFISRITKRP